MASKCYIMRQRKTAWEGTAWRVATVRSCCPHGCRPIWPRRFGRGRVPRTAAHGGPARPYGAGGDGRGPGGAFRAGAGYRLTV